MKGLGESGLQCKTPFLLIKQHPKLGDIFTFSCDCFPMFLSDIVLSFHFVFRNFERLGLDFLRKVKPMLSDLNTYLSKVGQNNNAVILSEYVNV